MMSSNTSAKEPMIYIYSLLPCLFIYLPHFKIFMNSTFGYSSVLAYAPVDSQNPALDTLFGQNSAVGHHLL